MRLSLVTLAVSLAASPAFAEEPGNLWEVTTSMEASGMSMPGRTQQVCAPVNAEGPEAMSGDDKRCEMSDIRRSPGRFSYKVKCPEGSGTGEMTYQGRDSYTSVMTMTMDGDTMKVSTKGKRIGSCDASKVKKQIAAAQAQGNAAMEQACVGAREQMMPSQLTALNCDAKYKKQLCDSFGTKAGFRTVAARRPVGEPTMDSGTLNGVAKFCGVKAEQVRDRLCADAGKGGDLDFIAGQCPALAQPIAQRECAGRGFTSPPAEKYRSFCSTYAQGQSQGQGEAQGQEQGTERGQEQGQSSETPASESPAPSKTDALKEGAKRLKGLFGR